MPSQLFNSTTLWLNAIFDQLGTLAQNAPPAVVAQLLAAVAQLRTDLEELSDQHTEQIDNSNAAAASMANMITQMYNRTHTNNLRPLRYPVTNGVPANQPETAQQIREMLADDARALLDDLAMPHEPDISREDAHTLLLQAYGLED